MTVENSIFTEEVKRWLNDFREQVESGKSSVFETIAFGYLRESANGKRKSLNRALKLFEMHNQTYSRRARQPDVRSGILKIPGAVTDKDGIELPEFFKEYLQAVFSQPNLRE